MKKVKKEINIKVNRKIIGAVFLLLVLTCFGFIVSAEWDVTKDFWHSGEDVRVEVDGEAYSLQGAIDGGVFTPTLPGGSGLSGGDAKVTDVVSTLGRSGSTICVIIKGNEKKVKCAGRNSHGQLGIGDTSNRNKFTEISGLVNVKALYADRLTFFAVLNDGTVKAWGTNGEGQLGVGDRSKSTSPVTVEVSAGSPLTNIDKLSTRRSTYGHEYLCALTNDGDVYCWGENSQGQLGHGDRDDRRYAQKVQALDSDNVIDIRVGGHSSGGFTCALIEGGTVKCWGYNYYYQIADGTRTRVLSPKAIPGLSNVKAIELAQADQGYVMAILNDGTVKSWGYNSYGQLGVGSTTHGQTPAVVPDLTGVEQIEIVGNGGGSSVCAVISNGDVKCWGYNYRGQLGIGDPSPYDDDKKVPTQVSISGVKTDGTGLRGYAYGNLGHFCALTNGEEVYCWGYNSKGQLGLGDTSYRGAPVKVGLTATKKIAVGGQGSAGNSCAILTDDTLRCWGDNGYGQLGTEDTRKALTPIQPQ